ncbi:MAG: DNA-binding protein WhiA [Clostridia bacterium]|nr:DNA-binding protein WhiA [Clostridia bacterium]
MSFANELRRELALLPVKRPCCRKALLQGLLLGAVAEGAKQVSFRLTEQECATMACEQIHTLFACEPQVVQSGAHGRRYWDLSFSSSAAAKLVRTLQSAGDGQACCVKAVCEGCLAHFLRGAFLSCGTVSDPHKSFHLEFSVTNSGAEHTLACVLELAGYPARRTVREGKIGLYYKDSSSIEELITMMGAHHLIFEVMNSRIERDIRNNENRATNCVAKNIEKSISAATRQMEAIDKLMETGKLLSLDEALRTTAELRYQHPDATLDELTLLHCPTISKSGLNHRLQRLIEAAKDL